MFNALNIWKSRFRHVGGQLLIECIQFCLAVRHPSRGAWQASSSPSEKSSVIIQLNSGPFHILGKRAMGIEMQSGSADGDLRIRAQARYNRLRFLTHFAGVWINAMVKVNPYDAIVVEDEPHTIIWLLPSLSLRLLIKRLLLVVGCPGPRIVRFRLLRYACSTSDIGDLGRFALLILIVAPYNPLRQCTQLRSEEHTSELQSRQYLVCRLLLEKK